jgi:hypothetical protein
MPDCPTRRPVPAAEAADAAAAVEGLLYEYAFRLDGGDLDGVAELFAAATWRSANRTLRGRDAVRTAYDPVRLYADGRPGTQHVITNVQIAVAPDGATASSRCYFTVLQVARIILAGRYHDTFARGPSGAWHYTDRLILPDLRGDLSVHYR